MNRRQTLLALSTTILAGLPLKALADDALKAAIAGAWRTPTEKARDAYRHPEESLTFWGLKPGATVIEISPGSGYWLEILAPYAKATGGKYIATGTATPFQARLTNAAYGSPGFTGDFGMTSGPLGATGSADMVITARNIHNWLWVPGQVEKAMKDFYAVLKPGGVLAVEEHRADPRPMAAVGGRLASDGYVSTQAVIDAATKAGFKLDGRSEVNANARDKKDHPFGVWTLPPTNRVGRPLPANWDPAVYKAIGESDRMTLRFKKA